ncbi:MAG: hypothetical protein GX344_05670 [Intrasporangiaceae bacterium]|nr:hypothetical protein [Intrasporangiaceae bacterium]
MSSPPSAPPDAGTLVPPVHPGLRPLLRSDGTLQLGHDPVHGLLLEGLHEEELGPASHLLRLLAGAAGPLPAGSLARATGLSTERVHEISAAVEGAGLTVSGPAALPAGGLAAWSLARLRQGPEVSISAQVVSLLTDRRAGALVTIDGSGQLAAEITRLLTAARVGGVRSGCYAAVTEDLDPIQPDPTLVITVATRLPFARAADWQERGIAHLPVVARPASIDIGPLIVPGQGPCLACVAASETAGLTPFTIEDPIEDGQTETVHTEPSLTAVAAGAAAMLALGHLDAYPPPIGVRWHCALPLPSLATTSWRVHPACSSSTHRSRITPGQNRPA